MLSIFFILSPCSGTIISGYSKTLIDNSLKTHLGKALIPYKKFKKIHMVEPGLLKGNFWLYLTFIICGQFVMSFHNCQAWIKVPNAKHRDFDQVAE